MIWKKWKLFSILESLLVSSTLTVLLSHLCLGIKSWYNGVFEYKLVASKLLTIFVGFCYSFAEALILEASTFVL